MDIKPSGNEYTGSGNVILNVDGPKNIAVSIQTRVNKQSALGNVLLEAGATCSKSKHESRSCCETIDKNGKKLCCLFKNKLQQFYESLTLPKVAWIDEGCDLSLVEHFAQLELDDSKKAIRIEDIFNLVNDKKPVRILIEGSPGFGKTTLATKLAYDWAKNEEYINFEFTFFIPLRELKQRSIKDAIFEIGKHCEYPDNEIEMMIQCHKEEILLIMDGLDEMTQKDRYEVLKILYKQSYSEMTVVVFSRTGLFALSKPERHRLFGQTSKKNDFHEKRINILGVQTYVNKRDFLKKIIPETKVNDIMDQLSSQMDLFDSPLFLMMIPIIMEEGKLQGPFSSKTQFYQNLFNCILKHSYIKREKEIDSDFDLFHFNSSPNKIQQQMRQFGELSKQKLIKSDLKFDVDELTEEIYELGLLLNHKEMTFFTTKYHYEGFHLSILEFAAAFALWMDFKTNESAFTQSLLEPMINHFMESRGESLIMPFLVGLMAENFDSLLIQIDSYSAWFSANLYLTTKLFTECSSNNIATSKNLKNFISSELFLTDNGYNDYGYKYHLDTYKKLLKYGCSCGKIKLISIIAFNLIPSEIFTSDLTARLELFYSISCGKLRLYLNDSCNMQEIIAYLTSFHGEFHGGPEQCLRFAASRYIEYSDLQLTRNSDCSPQLLEMIQKIKYRCLDVVIGNEMRKKCIIHLLVNNQVQHLKVSLGHSNDGPDRVQLGDLVRAAARSTYLTSFSGDRVAIDLCDLTNGGTKKYDFICLYFCSVTCGQSVSFESSCSCLSLRHSGSMEAITMIVPSKLICSIVEIKILIDKYPKWDGFSSVQYLKLDHVHKDYENCKRDCFSACWTNLQVLHLQSDYEYVTGSDIERLKIVKLVIDKWNNSTVNLFEDLNDYAERNSLRYLKTIEFSYLSSSKEEVLELMRGLKCKHWDKVKLIADITHLCESKDCLSELKVTHYNFTDYNCEYSHKRSFGIFQSLTQKYRCLAISRKSKD